MKTWLICYGGSDEDGVRAYTFKGTDDEVKALLVRAIQQLIEGEDLEEAEYYTESVDEVEEHDYEGASGAYYAYVSFSTYHVDVEAIPVAGLIPWYE